MATDIFFLPMKDVIILFTNHLDLDMVQVMNKMIKLIQDHCQITRA